MTTKRSFVGIILGAGSGSRMGIPKPLIRFADKRTFLSRLRDSYQQASIPMLCVVGSSGKQIISQHSDVSFIENSHWKDGQFSSVVCGIRAAAARGYWAALLHPVDCPRVAPVTLSTLTEPLIAHDDLSAVLPSFNSVPGHPVALRIDRFLEAVQGELPPQTLEQWIASIKSVHVPTSDEAVVENINTVAELKVALEKDRQTS